MGRKLGYEVLIDKPLQEVWDYTNNPDNLHLWLNDFLRSEHLTGDIANPKVGDTTRQTYSQGKSEFTMIEEITAYDPPNNMTLMMTSKMMDIEIINNFEAVSPNQTRLFAGAEFVRLGMIMKVMFMITPQKKMQADHERQINKLKELIEAL